VRASAPVWPKGDFNAFASDRQMTRCIGNVWRFRRHDSYHRRYSTDVGKASSIRQDFECRIPAKMV
jgi:hypothetical protein